MLSGTNPMNCHTRIFISLFLAIHFSSLIAQDWRIFPSPTRQNFSRLDMVSNELGWAVSYDGLILKYDGHEWTITDSLYRLEQRYTDFTNNSESSNTDWGDILPIRVLDANVGWIGVNNVQTRHYLMLPHINQQWRAEPSFFPAKIRAIDFYNKNLGIAVGDGVFQCTNGEWETIYLPVTGDYRTVKIISPEIIFIAGAGGTILRKDHEWHILKSPTSEMIRDMDFLTSDDGWFVGNHGTILHYQNGEINLVPTPTKETIWAVDMVTPDYGFAVGKHGLILFFNGKSWQQITSPTQAMLHDLEMIDKEHGWAVGAWGTILKFGLDAEPISQKDPEFLFYDQVKYGKNLMDKITDVEAVTFADYNRDDFADVYLTCSRNLNHLLLNDGSGNYNEFVIEAGTGGNVDMRYTETVPKIEKGALAADFNRDGNTDLFLAGLRKTSRFFMNNGNAIFENTTLQSGFPADLNIFDGAFADFDEDGYPDMVFADESKGLRLFLNQKYGTFTEQNTQNLNLPISGMHALVAADFNFDYHTDVLVFYHQIKPVLLFNDGNSNYRKQTLPCSENIDFSLVNSVTVADFNTDGFNDLFVCTENGSDALLLFDDNSKEFQNLSNQWNVLQGGRSYSGAAGDFDNDGDVDLFVSRFGNDFLYLNENRQSFCERSRDLILAKDKYLSGFNSGTAIADIDRDGDLDLLVGNRDYWSPLLQNTTNDSNFLLIRMTGTLDTYESLGAKIWVWARDSVVSQNNLVAFREINASNGLSSQNWTTQHIGLADYDNVTVKVRFLNGHEEVFENVSRGTTLDIQQANFVVRTAYEVSRATLQFLHQPQVPYEIIKLLVFILSILGSVRFIEKRYHWHSTKTAIYVLVLVLFYPLFSFYFIDVTHPYHHIIPFGVISFALLILVSVNEQLRKSTLRLNFAREKIQETANSLNRLIDEEKAIALVLKTIRRICNYSQLTYYSYDKSSNNLILRKEDNSFTDYKNTIKMEQSDLDRLLKKLSPVTGKIACNLLTDGQSYCEETLLYPVVRKKEMYGLLVIAGKENRDNIDQQIISLLNFLSQQFANAIHNIRMINDYHEQQKLAAIGMYAGDMMHDLKNPIDGLRMIIETLEKKTSRDDRRNKYIQALSQGILKLKETLLHGFDLVNYSHQTKIKVNINDLIVNIAKSYKKKKYPPIVIALDEHVVGIHGNPVQLKHAVENLLENAFEASNYSKPVQLSSKVNSRDKKICIDVIDEGNGIPDAKLGKIYDMFYSTHGNGRGLGLTITRNIIQNHGGSISVESNMKTGTRFTIQLPLVQDNFEQ